MRIDIITLFPEMFQAIESAGVVGRAIKQGLIDLAYVNPRDFSDNRQHQVDDSSYGGGPGMVMLAQSLKGALDHAQAAMDKRRRVIYLSPQGAQLNHRKALEISKDAGVILLCGRYEGIDQRIIDHYCDEELSIGDYVLSGGELAAMVVVDAVSRLIPGVLGHQASASDESFVDGLLDYPHYTRPRSFEGIAVPDVLLSGDHQAIKRWRLKQSLGQTWQKRPDLIADKALDEEQAALLNEYIKDYEGSSKH